MSYTSPSCQDEGLVPASGRALATSTPAPALAGGCHPTKPDMSQLFQKLGDKLGWFQYDNTDAAIQTLSKSAKKKSARPQRDKDSSKLASDTSGTQSRPRRKLKKTKPKSENECHSSEEGKENKKPARRNVKVKSHSPLSSGSVSTQDDKEHGVPLRKSAACTDLTRSHTKQEDRGKLGLKIKNIVGAAESPGSDLPESNIQKKGHKFRQSSVRSSSESPECLVTESTRIHSDASLECVLDSADVSAISFHRNDSLSGTTRIDSFLYNSNDDSYKQLNIKDQRSRLIDVSSKSPDTSSTDSNVCLDFQDLRIDNSEQFNGKGNNSSNTVNTSDLYTTAKGPCIIEGSLEVSRSEKDIKEPSSGSSYEVEDVSVQVCSESEIFNYRKSNKCMSEKTVDHRSHKHSDTSSGSGSSYEVEDVSVQVESDNVIEEPCVISHTSQTSKHKHFKKSGSSSSEKNSDSFVEVEDVSMQTSFQMLPDPHQIYKTDNSCDVVEDFAKHKHKQMESIDDSNQASLQDLNNISLPDLDLDLDLQPQTTFSKRDPSIYFDAKDLSQLPTKFNKRDPSIYFDAKQSLLSSSSQSSNSSCEQFNYPRDSINSRPKGDSYNEKIPTGVISVSDTDSDDHSVEKTTKMSKMKKPKTEIFLSDSDGDLVSYSHLQNKKTKSQRKYSSSSDSSKESVGIKSISRKTNGHKFRSTRTGKSASRQKFKYSIDEESDESLPDLGNEQKASPLSNKHWRTTQTIEADSSSDDDALENFFQKMKGSKKKPSTSSEEEEKSEKMSMKKFIVEDWEVSEDDEDDVFYMSTAYKTSFHSTEDHKNILPIVFRDSSSEDEDFKTPRVKGKSSTDHGFKTPISTTKKNPRKLQTPGTDIWGLKEDNCVYPSSTEYSFLKSLTENLPVNKCDPEAIRFIKTFKKSKQELTQRLFKMYNETVFENKLPEDLEVIWNSRLLKTAGYCVYKKVATSAGARSVRIELSTKVCDSAERVRDTLIHELCHAAVWLVNGLTDGHGPYWKYWAKKSNQTHPEIPVIGRCHSYSISTKFTYQCSQCGYRIGRHSKSLDTDRKVCGYCHGRFTLLSNTGRSGSTPVSAPSTPRTPNKFALFVKENYGDIKKREQALKHKDIMKILSQEFAKNKISG